MVCKHTVCACVDDCTRCKLITHLAPSSARGADAAKRAKILEEYLVRKREAALNKARGVYDPYGGVSRSSSKISIDMRLDNQGPVDH